MKLISSLHPSNSHCADCGAASPDWASINFGIVICLDCSGIHRSLGTHLSKVRSLTLDRWDQELFCLYSKLGNEIANSILELYVCFSCGVFPLSDFLFLAGSARTRCTEDSQRRRRCPNVEFSSRRSIRRRRLFRVSSFRPVSTIRL